MTTNEERLERLIKAIEKANNLSWWRNWTLMLILVFAVISFGNMK